jgi:hypothetical protein
VHVEETLRGTRGEMHRTRAQSNLELLAQGFVEGGSLGAALVSFEAEEEAHLKPCFLNV